MNIQIPHSWLSEYVKTNKSPSVIARLLSLYSAEVEKLEQKKDDWIYHIEITTNRPDMASVIGMARETAAVLTHNNIPAKFAMPKNEKLYPAILKDTVYITPDYSLCSRVIGVVIKQVQSIPSPSWIKTRLEKSGIRPLNALVDITNYIMLETGQPMHVFDYDRLKTKKFIIRQSKKGEHIITFEGKKRILSGGDIVIDDGTGTLIDLPGIAGAKNSVVTEKTKNIFLFTEHNNPYLIRKTTMSLALHTYASSINKTNPDPESARFAFEKGILLYQKLFPHLKRGKIVDYYKKEKKPPQITVDYSLINTYLGISIPPKKILALLSSLGLSASIKNGVLVATPPSYRAYDITRKEDIIEEIARLYGYHNIPSRLAIPYPASLPLKKKYNTIQKIKYMLKYRGYTELYTSSFISKKILKKIALYDKNVIAVKNPLTKDEAYLRPSLIPHVLQAVQENKYRKETIRVFELSNIYIKNNKRKNTNQPIQEEKMLTIALYQEKEKSAFYTLKGLVKNIGKELGVLLSFIPIVDHSCPIAKIFHPSMRALILLQTKNTKIPIGCMGKINDVIVADISFTSLVKYQNLQKTYHPIPEYPPVIEDLTIPIKENTLMGDVINRIKQVDKKIIQVKIVSQYKNKVTFRIVLQDKNKNLTKKETAKILERIRINTL